MNNKNFGVSQSFAVAYCPTGKLMILGSVAYRVHYTTYLGLRSFHVIGNEADIFIHPAHNIQTTTDW